MFMGTKGEKGATEPKGDAGTANIAKFDLISNKLEGVWWYRI